MEEIARWASERKWSKNYFVDIIIKEKRRVLSIAGSVAAVSAALYGSKESDDRYRAVTVPINIKSTHPLPFETIEIIARPTKRSLKQLGALIGIVHSRTNALILSTTIMYKDVGWDERVIDTSTVEWTIMELMWKDMVSNPIIITEDVLSQLENEISDYLKSFIKEEEGTNFEQSKNPKTLIENWMNWC